MPLNPELELHLVDNIDEAMAMKRWLGERRDVLGLDTETTGLNPYAPGANLRLVQLGDTRAGWAVPWERWGGVAMECLNAWDGQLTLHNLPFDSAWLRVHAGWEMPWERAHDTLIMAQMLRPGQPAGLKPLVSKFVDPRANAGEFLLKDAMEKQGWGWDTIPIDFPAYWNYSALDPVLAAELWSHFRADLKYPKAYDLEMAARRICSRMEENGVRVDLDYTEKTLDRLNSYVEQSKQWCQDTLGVRMGSNVQLIRYFQDELHAEVERRTPGGAPSLDKEQLAIFAASDNPRAAEFAQFILNVRKADKMCTSYLTNFLDMHTDGLVHPQIKTLQAITGRMSITNPALQTLGKGDATIRNCFVPTNENESIIASDLDQVEFRMFAHLSQDDELCQTFIRADATGSDAFTEIGREVYQDPEMKKADKRRALVKGVIYGKLYGASVRKQALTAKVPEEQMRAVSTALESRYPGIKRYQQQMDGVVTQREKLESGGYIHTELTGRRIPVEDGKAYRGVNYTIQASAAEVFKQNLIRLDAAGLGEYLRVPVHDEIVLSVPNDMLTDAMRTVQSCMTSTDEDGWRVPLTSGVDGPYERWGDKYQ